MTEEFSIPTANRVITAVNQVTVEWLTAVLAQNGAITQGTITSFARDKGAGNWSTNAKINVAYSGKAWRYISYCGFGEN